MAEVRRGTSTGDEHALPGSVPFVSLMGVVSSLNSTRMCAMMESVTPMKTRNDVRGRARGGT
jgi:hypothetical protein